jgi:phage shock protein PspC (stress-responsive transcriptional regulator)
MNKFKSFVEWNAFGVCSAIGNRMGIATSRIRLYFIYASLLTMGSRLLFTWCWLSGETCGIM